MSEKRVRFSSENTHYGFPEEAFDISMLPDIDTNFIDPEDLRAFERALQAPDPLQSPTAEESTTSLRRSSSIDITKRSSLYAGDEDVSGAASTSGAAGGGLQSPTFITAQNDWAPVNAQVYKNKRGSKRRRKRAQSAVEGLLGTRTKDETREGHLYQVSKWPLLIFVFAWLGGLAIAYFSTRWYIFIYEQFFTWRGQRQQLRNHMRQTSNYRDWVAAAKELDKYLGRQAWKEENDFAYYDSRTVKRVWNQMRDTRLKAEEAEGKDAPGDSANELRALVEACMKNNFAGVENARLYSQTYYGTKNLVQNFVDECKPR